MNDPIVACYFKDIGGSFSNQSKDLIKLWEKSWSDCGWKVFVLNEEHAKKNKLYNPDIFLGDSNLMKNTNPSNPLYIQACYERWFAYDYLVGEYEIINWADYDVINYSYYKCDEVLNHRYDPSYCCGSANSSVLSSIVEIILKYAFIEEELFLGLKMLHNSDMWLLARTSNMPIHRLCCNPCDGTSAYKGAKLVHFHGGVSNFFNLNNSSRLEIVQELRKHE